MITCAKGMTSGYSPIGACIISDRLAEPFYKGDNTSCTATPSAATRSPPRWRWPTSTSSSARASTSTCWTTRAPSSSTLEKLHDLPIVGDVRGNGFFYGIELVKDKATKETFNDEESERVLYGFLSKALFDNGLYCRADDRGDPVIQLAPPLISDQADFDEIEQILRSVLTEAWTSSERSAVHDPVTSVSCTATGTLPQAATEPRTAIEVTMPLAVS